MCVRRAVPMLAGRFGASLLDDALSMPIPPGYHAPALPPAMAAADRQYLVSPAKVGAPRWHIGYDVERERYLVSLRLFADAPCCDVCPSKAGMRYALKLADALNRAYGIDPVAGYDATPRLFGLW